MDRHFADWLRRQKIPAALVANKCEGKGGDAGLYEAYELGFGQPIPVSAEHGDGMEDLYRLLQPHVDKARTQNALPAPDAEEDLEKLFDIYQEGAETGFGDQAPETEEAHKHVRIAIDPGIYSARWAGESRDFGVAMRRVHEGIGASSDRSARFVCALALCWPDGHAEVFEGDVKGNLIWPPRGGTGFGYDPIFVPAGYDVTFSEMHGEEKQKIDLCANSRCGKTDAI